MKGIYNRGVVIAFLCVALVGCQTNATMVEPEVFPDVSRNDGEDAVVVQPGIDGTIILSDKEIYVPENVVVDGSTITISASGIYEITGVMTNGQIVVDAADSVTLLLNNANLHCNYSSPLYIREADQVTITLAENSVNTITDDGSYIMDESVTEPDAALYSKADMVINGNGTLKVTTGYNDGIASRDTLRIDGGTIVVKAQNHGIKGKDYLMIHGGNITIEAKGDGAKSTNDSEMALGYVTITGGILHITAEDEGLSAISAISITGGDITIDTLNNGIKSEGTLDITGGVVNIQTNDDGLLCSDGFIGAEANVSVNGQIFRFH